MAGSSRFAFLMLAVVTTASAALLAGCTPTTNEAVVQSPPRPVERSSVVSATAGPEAVVQAFMDAAGRGDGDAMNALFGPNPSTLFANVVEGNAAITGVVVHSATPATESASVEDTSTFGVSEPNPDEPSPADRVNVSVDLTAPSEGTYFALEAGPNTLDFTLHREGAGEPWYIVSLSARAR